MFDKIKTLLKFPQKDPLKVQEKKKQKYIKNHAPAKRTIPTLLFFIISVLYFETLLHFDLNSGFFSNYYFAVLFSIPIGITLFLLSNLFNSRRTNIICGWVILVFIAVIFEVQLYYYKVFAGYLSVFLIQTGADAITSFWDQLMAEIADNLLIGILILLPLPIFGILLKFKVVELERRPLKTKLYSLISVFVIQISLILLLFAFGTNPYSPFDVYYGDDAETTQSAQTFGVLTTMRLEFKHMLAGRKYESIEKESTDDPNDEVEIANENAEYNIIPEIDFDKLDTLTKKPAVKSLNSYLATKTGSEKNKYTGLFKDKNLIVLCCESFSPYVIDKDRTPALYRLSHEGFVFKNFYNCYPNNTTNGEYTLCMGNFPDLSRSKSNGSFKYSFDKYLPFCLGRMFEDSGVKSWAYHDYKGSYYSRENTHPNMGYSTFRSASDGMVFTTSWPASDLEMMEQSVDDYIHQDKFHAYYMTFSGHYQYNFTTNPMSIRNYDKVMSLPYSDTVKAYIACNLELEYALEYLMDRLDKAGKLNDTVIVLTNDHYPYGLTDQEYNELAGKKIDTSFERYRNSFICWSGDMKEPVEIDEYCCSIDILPTLLNLFGMKYDSRLMVGTDILSNSEHIAILANQSFINNKVKFDSSKNVATYTVSKKDLPEKYLDNTIKKVRNKITVSALILNTDYYRFVWENTFPEKLASDQEKHDAYFVSFNERMNKNANDGKDDD